MLDQLLYFAHHICQDPRFLHAISKDWSDQTVPSLVNCLTSGNEHQFTYSSTFHIYHKYLEYLTPYFTDSTIFTFILEQPNSICIKRKKCYPNISGKYSTCAYLGKITCYLSASSLKNCTRTKLSNMYCNIAHKILVYWYHSSGL